MLFFSSKNCSYYGVTFVEAGSQRCSYCYEEHLENNNKVDISNSSRKIHDNVVEDKNVMNMDQPKTAFTDFYESTGLHGWQHLGRRGTHLGQSRTAGGKYMWILIVVASIAVASFFLFTSVDDFTSKYVVTNIDTTTAPLHVC